MTSQTPAVEEIRDGDTVIAIILRSTGAYGFEVLEECSMVDLA